MNRIWLVAVVTEYHLGGALTLQHTATRYHEGLIYGFDAVAWCSLLQHCNVTVCLLSIYEVLLSQCGADWGKVLMTLSMYHEETWDIMKNTVLDTSVQLLPFFGRPQIPVSDQCMLCFNWSKTKGHRQLTKSSVGQDHKISQIHHIVHVSWKNTQN